MSEPTRGSGLFGTFEPKPVKEHSASHKKRYTDYGPEWDDLANTCLTLAGHLCQDCKKNRAINAHHIIPLTKGGANALHNLKALCFHCHAKYHPHLGRRKTDIERCHKLLEIL
jgi:5-methylcytosine-specific restriction endonuclease McrA